MRQIFVIALAGRTECFRRKHQNQCRKYRWGDKQLLKQCASCSSMNVRVWVRVYTFIWRVIWLLQRSWNVAHTALNWRRNLPHICRANAKLWRPNFKDTKEVWTSVKSEQKSFFQGTKKASVLDYNMCESRGIAMQLKLFCSCWGCK
jgi:hypothetical protein